MKLPSGTGLWLFGLGCAGSLGLSSPAVGTMPGITRTERTEQKDRRVVADRKADSFLNAVGAVWSYGVGKSGAGYDASTGNRAATGFLIDRCHVLTNMHVVYADSLVVDPPTASPVAFAVGQTESEKDRGALQGLKFLLQGTVIAHGNSIIVDGLIHDPQEDWAVIRLAGNVDRAITPMKIDAVDLAQLPKGLELSAAGYPSDHRARRGDGFKMKDLWRSDGHVVGVVPVSAVGALIQTTIQTTPGNSGGPLYGDFRGRQHIVVGMVQSIRGNGIDVSERNPNVQILFTPGTITKIANALAQSPCDASPIP